MRTLALVAALGCLAAAPALAVERAQCTERHDEKSWDITLTAKVDTSKGPLTVEHSASGTAGKAPAFRHHLVFRVAGRLWLTADVESGPLGQRFELAVEPDQRSVSARHDRQGRWSATVDGHELERFEVGYPLKARRADRQPIAPFAVDEVLVEALKRLHEAAKQNSVACIKKPVAVDRCGECGGAFAFHAATDLMRAAALANRHGPLGFPGYALLIPTVERAQCSDCREATAP